MFKNEEYTLYLACVWARTLDERRIYTAFSVCLGSHDSRTRNIHIIFITILYSACVWARTLYERGMYIALALLGSHTLCSLQMAYLKPVYFSTGTNRQVVSAGSQVLIYAGACFSKVPRTFRARKGTCQTAIRLF